MRNPLRIFYYIRYYYGQKLNGYRGKISLIKCLKLWWIIER